MSNDWLFSGLRVAVRGGGDLGSGVIYRLARAGIPVLVTELPFPLLVRRSVTYGSAMLEGSIEVEGVTAAFAKDLTVARQHLSSGRIPVMADNAGETIASFAPHVVIDARMRKRPPDDWPGKPVLRVGLGPGFNVPENCDAVIETNRGHHLGRAIVAGSAEPDTGIPGRVKGQTASRVLRSPTAGETHDSLPIGSSIVEGQVVVSVSGEPVLAPFDGVLRGVVFDGSTVKEGMKIGDVDPRNDPSYINHISDKSLAIGGGVLEAVLSHPSIRQHLRNQG